MNDGLREALERKAARIHPTNRRDDLPMSIKLTYGDLRALTDALSVSPPSTEVETPGDALRRMVAIDEEIEASNPGYLDEALPPRDEAAPTVQADTYADWFAGDVDCDGNELVTIRADELQRLRDEREKFMWQVRDTCTRAEKAEAALAPTPDTGDGWRGLDATDEDHIEAVAEALFDHDARNAKKRWREASRMVHDRHVDKAAWVLSQASKIVAPPAVKGAE